MAVHKRTSVARYMLDDAGDACFGHTVQHRAAKGRALHRIPAERAVADNLASARLAYVEQGKAVHINADFRQQHGNCLCIAAGGLDGCRRSVAIEFREPPCRRKFRPAGRTQASDPPAFLIDEDRQIAPPAYRTQVVGQRP